MGLAFTFNKTSDWPAKVKIMASATAYCVLFSGVALSNSYRYQLEFKQMKISLMLSVLLFILLVLYL